MTKLGVGWVTINEMMDFRGEELPDEEIMKDWACQYPFQRLTVSANGSILPCTGAHNEEDELVLGRYIGSAKKEVLDREQNAKTILYPEMSLKEAWSCAKLQNIRRLHQENRRCEIRGCRNCRHGVIKKGVEWIPPDWDMETMTWKGRAWRT
jgi:hypothetical protein